jgi:hypothetical protein
VIWFRNNGGPWNGDPSADPTTGIGGIDVSVLTGPYFAAASYNTGFTGGQTLTGNFGAASFANSPGAGVSAWGAATTFDPAHTNSEITLLSGNLSFTTGGEQTGPATRSTTSTATQTGLRYWEFAAGTAPQNWFAGIAIGSAPDTFGAGMGYAVVADSGSIQINGVTQSQSVGAFSAGDVMGIVIGFAGSGGNFFFTT